MHPKFHEAFESYSDNTPQQNPLAPNCATENLRATKSRAMSMEPGSSPWAQSTQGQFSPESNEGGAGDFAQSDDELFMRLTSLSSSRDTLFRKINMMETQSTIQCSSSWTCSNYPHSARARLTTQSDSSTRGDHAGIINDNVVVENLKPGSIYGVMEMMEGLTYQRSVIAYPFADIYVITKHDFLRNTSKSIVYKLFCDYKSRVADDRLILRMKQKAKWNSYKKRPFGRHPTSKEQKRIKRYTQSASQECSGGSLSKRL